MRKIILALMLVICLGASAQTAIETPKTFDNVYVGAQLGVSTPMSFNSTFPLNTSVGVKIGKNLTPIIGVNLEGNMWFGSATNDQGRFSWRNGIRATNVGLNATIDMLNWITGYQERAFSVVPEVGIGWLHMFNAGFDDQNDLSAKTGIQLTYNISNAWQLYAEPTVWWNLTKNNKVRFNKNNAQLGLQVGFIYKFKNSNGTHGFVVHNVGAMNDEINSLRGNVATLNNQVAALNQQVDSLEAIKPIHDTIVSYSAPYHICFAQNSAELTEEAKKVLDSIPTNIKVSIQATASPEGTEEYNLALSKKRAEAVMNYLKDHDIQSSEGVGVTGDASNRLAIITVIP